MSSVKKDGQICQLNSIVIFSWKYIPLEQTKKDLECLWIGWIWPGLEVQHSVTTKVTADSGGRSNLLSCCVWITLEYFNRITDNYGWCKKRGKYFLGKNVSSPFLEKIIYGFLLPNWEMYYLVIFWYLNLWNWSVLIIIF